MGNNISENEKGAKVTTLAVETLIPYDTIKNKTNKKSTGLSMETI